MVDLPHKPEVYEFELVLPDRVLRLRPKSESQRRHWVAAIQKMRSLAGCARPYRARASLGVCVCCRAERRAACTGDGFHNRRDHSLLAP